MLASEVTGGQFSILGPDETVGPDSEAWRAVAMTVPDERAVGGLVLPGMTVDVFLSATVNVPQDLLTAGKYYTDKATKITYQNMEILAKTGIVLHREGDARQSPRRSPTSRPPATPSFSFVLRPDADVRFADASKLGETTNLIIQRYGLPIPLNYPPGNGPIPSPVATPQPVAPAVPASRLAARVDRPVGRAAGPAAAGPLASRR